jgi:hypothetical protein
MTMTLPATCALRARCAVAELIARFAWLDSHQAVYPERHVAVARADRTICVVLVQRGSFRRPEDALLGSASGHA